MQQEKLFKWFLLALHVTPLILLLTLSLHLSRSLVHHLRRQLGGLSGRVRKLRDWTRGLGCRWSGIFDNERMHGRYTNFQVIVESYVRYIEGDVRDRRDCIILRFDGLLSLDQLSSSSSNIF